MQKHSELKLDIGKLMDGKFSYTEGQFIVRAVNAHQELIDALDEIGKQLQARVESAGHVIWGPTDFRAAEDGEPAWVCNARGAFAQARVALAKAKA